MSDRIARDVPGYRLLDSGDGRKLEEIAGWRMIRPCNQAIWRPNLPASEWDQAGSVCERTRSGGGQWTHHQAPPELVLHWEELELGLRLTDFGHCGVFFEQVPLWQRFRAHLQGRPQAKMANGFGYTGNASLAAAAVGAQVFHVDSAKGVLDWGKANQRRSGIAAEQVRWIHDDVRSFLALSIKRGWTYDVVYLDPPAFGHGKKKETWTFEQEVAQLAADGFAVLAPQGLLVISCHTPGVQREALVNLLRPFGQVVAGELGVAHAHDERVLPAGIYVEVQRD